MTLSFLPQAHNMKAVQKLDEASDKLAEANEDFDSVEGQKLKAGGDSFRAKLNTQDVFDDWARKVQQRNLGVSGRNFTIVNTGARIGTGKEIFHVIYKF